MSTEDSGSSASEVASRLTIFKKSVHQTNRYVQLLLGADCSGDHLVADAMITPIVSHTSLRGPTAGKCEGRMDIGTIFLLMIAVVVAVWVISVLARKHVYAVTSLSPEDAGSGAITAIC